MREREIIENLKKNPLISQDQLAAGLGISRSSVAVHISNLMKKGVILGKGYVFNEQASIVVVGLSYLEIKACQQGEQGVVNLEYRGLPVVASEILAGFGINLKIISLIGNDQPGDMIVNRLMENKVETVHIHRHPRKRTCRRISLGDGEIIEEGFNPDDYKQVLNSREWIIFNCEWLIVDPYFQREVLARLGKKDEENTPHLCTSFFMLGPGELPEGLLQYNTVVLGVARSNDVDYYRKQLEDRTETPDNIIITDGRSRLIYRSRETDGDYPLPPNQSFDSEEGLCGLLTGIIYGLVSGYPLRQAIRIGAGLASSSDVTR